MHSVFYIASIFFAIGSIGLVAYLSPGSRTTPWWMRDTIFLVAAALASLIIGVAAYALIGRGFQ